MSRQPQDSRQVLLKMLVLLILIGGIEAGLTGVAISPATINSIATYTWTISFNNGTPYVPLTLAFPSAVLLLSNCTVSINGSFPTFNKSNTALTITSNITQATVTIIVGNVQNPPSAISTSAFSYTNSKDGTVSLSGGNAVAYEAGVFSSCPWSFSLCTEQTGSDLLISITTVNRIPSGTNYFLIGYGFKWDNHYAKGLVSNVGSLMCSYSTDAGITYTTPSSCSVNSTNVRIQYPFTSSGIAGGTSIVVKVSGVNAPPTMQTTTSSTYSIYTADSSMATIDGLSSCFINNVCITNQTVGTFTSSTMNVNGNFGNPEIRFPLTPVTITIQLQDTVQVSYSPFSSLLTCGTLRVYRSTPVYSLTSPTSSASLVTFTFPSNMGYNVDYNNPFNALLLCTGFLLPPSETPTTLSFTFKRNSDTYLQLSSPVTASATAFNSSRAVLSLTSTALVTSSILTFNFLIGQPLGSTPAIAFTFPSDFTVSSPTCTVSILSITVSSSSCALNGTNIVIVSLATSNIIPSGSNFTITVRGVVNPAVPKNYSIALNTYYFSNVNSSRVETSLTAFTATITEILNYPVTLSPANLSVYTATDIVLSFVPNITIPTASTFYIEFPTGVSSISPTSTLLSVGGSSLPLNGTSALTSNSISVTCVSGAQIPSGSNVAITIRLTTQNNQGVYPYVMLIVSNNGTNYLSNKNSLFLNVNSVNSMSATITPLLSTTGVVSNYIFVLTLSIPHSTSFIVQIDVPSDTKFQSTGANCTSCITSTLSPVNASTLTFTASNPGGSGSQSITFNITSFVNPRSVGSSLPWGIATKTVSPVNLISYTNANATIQSPNTLTAVLSKSDSYYRNNTSPVRMTFTFANQLVSGDYILLSFTSDSYSATSVTCSPLYGACSIFNSTANVVVVKLVPNTTSIISNALFVIVEGLVSAAATSYSYRTNITVTSLTSSGALIDSGFMTYNISCGTNASNNCKQCYGNGSCINCYTGHYLQGTVCVSECGTPTSYMSYSNNATGTCVACINNCRTCDSAIVCRTCVTNYYFFTSDSSCRVNCPTTSGYFISGFNCIPCVSNCLECINGSNTCTRCNNLTLLSSGLCQSGCSSTNFYNLNGRCVACDVSCYNCSGAGSGSCYTCSAEYHKYLTQCVLNCPNGTAVNPSNGDCGCNSDCLTCSTYTSCTACLDPAMWVSNGACISSCPNATYANAGVCIPCSAGCLNCTINTCTNCVTGNYLFNNSCYSDCNLISQQYDAVGTSCVLCPSGCDHCSGSTCTSCLDAYTLNGTQCIKTCLLSNSCELNSQVLPLPGMLALGVWVGISVVIYFLYHKNYLPYSIVFFSAVVQFVLILALFSSVNSPTSRLLAASSAYQSQMRGLLAGAIVANYLENIAYLIIFICYIKPLISNPRQIDVISNVVVLVIATATNFRFGIVAFARMFPKPNIFIGDASKLTPIHYLCLISLVLDLLSVVACGLGLTNSQKLSNTFMLSMDLLIVIAVNIAITVWFVAVKKPEEYYEDSVKKYHMEDGHNRTDQTLPNEKNLSKAKINGDSMNFEDFENTENEEGSYKKLNKANSFSQNNSDDIKENTLPITVLARSQKQDPDPFLDPNFESNIKSKRDRVKDSMIISKADFAKNIDKDGKSVEDNLSARKNHVVTGNLGKDMIKSERKKVEPQKNIIEVEESDYPDLEDSSDKGPANLFNSKQRMDKPKKIKESKAKGVEESGRKAKGQASRVRGKGVEQPMKLMKKGDRKIGYFESDAYESNADGEDLEEIIKQKIWQSTLKLEKPSLSSGLEDETGHEEISPSWFNVQNQRLDITDLEDAEPE